MFLLLKSENRQNNCSPIYFTPNVHLRLPRHGFTGSDSVQSQTCLRTVISFACSRWGCFGVISHLTSRGNVLKKLSLVQDWCLKNSLGALDFEQSGQQGWPSKLKVIIPCASIVLTFCKEHWVGSVGVHHFCGLSCNFQNRQSRLLSDRPLL